MVGKKNRHVAKTAEQEEKEREEAGLCVCWE